MTKKADANQAEATVDKEVAVTSAETADDHVFSRLSATLAEIRKLNGVAGYILQGPASAIWDVAEGDKISQYALLSYQLSESCVEIARELSIAEVESVIVEGKRLKALFMKIGENKVSVFMEKNVDHFALIKRILT